jgi:translation initiation factor IF-3
VSKDYVVNEQIRSHLVTLIDQNGGSRGQVLKSAAIQLAKGEGLDLVQVSLGQPGSPPVCKIADYGKLRFDASKVQKKNHHQIQLKEIYFSSEIAQHDLDVKLKKVEQLLSKGHKVQLGLELSGRQKFNQNLRDFGREKLKRAIEHFTGKAVVSPQKEGEKLLTVTLTPV